MSIHPIDPVQNIEPILQTKIDLAAAHRLAVFHENNLETVIGREKDVRAIDLDSVMKKCVVTLLVISTFFI